MLELGTIAPSFTLTDTISGKKISIAEFSSSKGYLIAFMCNHCPFVIHLISKLAECCNNYKKQGIEVFAISSNDISEYPDDKPNLMKKIAIENNFTFPYLYDEDQSTALKYKAACTPDFFLFDKNKQLVYRGQFDDSRPNNSIPVTGNNLTEAINLVLKGKTPNPKTQKPSIGCNIKWKKGKEPEYFLTRE